MSTACITKSVRLKFVDLHVHDMYNRPSVRGTALAFPNDVLEEAARNFQPTGDCAGPIPNVGFHLERQARARWPGWFKLLRPGSVTQVSVTRSWPATVEYNDFKRSGTDPNRGGYSFTAHVSGRWHYSVTLRNVCRTIRVPARLRRQSAPYSSHGRVCASGTS